MPTESARLRVWDLGPLTLHILQNVASPCDRFSQAVVISVIVVLAFVAYQAEKVQSSSGLRVFWIRVQGSLAVNPSCLETKEP